MEMVNIKINGMPLSVPAGSTILEAARYAGIEYSDPVLAEGHQRDRRLPYLCGRGCPGKDPGYRLRLSG